MRTTGWIRNAVIGSVAAMALGAGQPDSGTAIVGGTAEQQAMARWAVGRFAAAGLSLPTLEIHLHADQKGCGGRLGNYLNGVANVCGSHTDLMAHRLVLHEMAHAWAEHNLSSDQRARFLELRGLTTWKDHTAEWSERGTEHAAEIMSWALGDQGTGINTPSIPDNSIEELTDAYELLTGNPLPEVSGQLS